MFQVFLMPAIKVIFPEKDIRLNKAFKLISPTMPFSVRGQCFRALIETNKVEPAKFDKQFCDIKFSSSSDITGNGATRISTFPSSQNPDALAPWNILFHEYVGQESFQMLVVN